MNMKRLILALMAMLMLALVIPACASAATGSVVYTPTNGDKYPVVYVMPENGYTNHANDIAGKLEKAMKAGDIMDMIIVKTEFPAGSTNLYEDMAAVISEVEGANAISDPSYRAVVGTGVGGYMAYLLTMTDNGGVLTAPKLFSAVASIRGDFTSANHPYKDQYGDIFSYISAASSNLYGKLYIYMDAPVDDPLTDEEGSTNDMGQVIMNFAADQGTAANQEFTVRLGSFDEAFVNESTERVADRFSKWIQKDMMTSEVKLVKQVIKPGEKAAVTYSIDIGSKYDQLTDEAQTMQIEIMLYDNEGNKIAGPYTDSVTVNGSGTYTNANSNNPAHQVSIQIANKVVDGSAIVKLSATLLGTKMELAQTTLFNELEPVYDGDFQYINLMGDWYFRYEGVDKGMPSSSIRNMTAASCAAEGWNIVQPGQNYGNITQARVSMEWTYDKLGYMAVYAPYMPDLFIVGSGYYVKTFYVDEKFDTQNPVLTIGRMDDRGQVFLNGTLIGETGMKDGVTTGETTWAAYSVFEFDPSLLKLGEENTIIVRNWNDTSGGGGGWYEADLGLYSAEAYAIMGGSQTSERFYEETYYSESVGQEMEYLVYLPKDYNETDRYYPTLYLMHQINSDHTSYLTDDVDQLMDEAISKGMFDEMIVVIPNSSESSWWKGKWEQMVINDLIPLIDEKYRTIDDARYRFTAGCSMGGQGAYSVALTNPDYFSGAISFFGAFDMGNSSGEISPMTVAENEGAEYMDNFSMAFICGNQDSYNFGIGKIEMHQILKDMGIDHYFFIENGEHNSAFYVPYYQDALSYVWRGMYDETELDEQEPNLRKIANASLVETEDGLVLVFAVNEKIEEYYNQIPASSYTENETPALSIPLRVTVTQDGKKYRALLRDYMLEQGVTMDAVALKAEDFVQLSRAGGAEGFDPEKKYTYTVEAAIFDNDWVPLNRVPGNLLGILPDTGDNSNMMLYALLLAGAACAMLVMKRSKARA